MRQQEKRPNQQDFFSQLQEMSKNIQQWINSNPEKAAGLAAAGAGAMLLSELFGDEEAGSDVEIIVWNVERGDCVLVKAPEGNFLIDLGRHREGFSPVDYMSSNDIDSIDHLVLTHPDKDHIEGLPAFRDKYGGATVVRPPDGTPYVYHRKESVNTDDETYQEIAEHYLDAVADNRQFVNSGGLVSYSSSALGIEIETYGLTAKELGKTHPSELADTNRGNCNDLSLTTVVKYNGFKFVSMGDIREDAIETLLQHRAYRDAVKDADVLLAPHHGRGSSYTGDLCDVVSPEMVAISDAGRHEHSAADSYRRHASGKHVENRSGVDRKRKVITTRNDNVLYFGVDSDSSYRVRVGMED